MSKYLDYDGLKHYNDKILEKIGNTSVLIETTDGKLSTEDYARIESAEYVIIKYNGLLYRKCARLNAEDPIQFECIYNDNKQEVAAFLAYAPRDEVAADGTVSVFVSDTSMLKVGMKVDFRSPLGGKIVLNKEIATIDETNKKVTFVGNVLSDMAGSNVYLTTYTSEKTFKLSGVTMLPEDESEGLVTADQWRSLDDYK
uniref:Uncharacterized protein n=1 Tax=Siphoviridae sp. ctrpg19 TaxID=2826481 RepID=A0A8S5ML72_9CAUD|nr:MAG TPA: hypothetical protein [Siphoviridae sp. ctrpg19]